MTSRKFNKKTNPRMPKPYLLACNHKVYFHIAPGNKEEIWCYRCANHQPLMATTFLNGRTYDPAGEYWIERLGGKKILGKCIHIEPGGEECDHSDEAWSVTALMQKLHSHHMSAHTRFGISSGSVPKKSRKITDVEPPF